MAIIKLENVSYTYPRTAAPALRGVSLEINEGDCVALMGQNGSGKTTFCKLINGVIPHSHNGKLEGTVIVDGLVTRETPVPVLASRVAVVHDDPDTQLFTSTVRDELAFGPENLGVEPDEIEGRVARALEETGLFPYSDTPPADLSGGQKQLLAIAAALVMEPRILVLDEPTSQLDPWAAAEVLALISRIRIARIQKRGGLTVIMATHNGEEAAEFADKICVLDEGKLAAYGSPREIFRNDELIRNAYIRRPDVSELSAYLSGHGRPLPLFPINIDEARDSIEAQAAIEAQNAIPGRSGV